MKNLVIVIGVVLVGFSQLFSMDILQEEHLEIRTLSNGVEAWVAENHLPAHMISLRVIWNKQDIPAEYALDCPSEEIDEIEGFFEFCLDKIDCSSNQVAVIAVGDVSKEELFSLIENYFQRLSQEDADLVKPPIVIRSVPNLPHVDIALMYPTTLQKLQDLNDLKQQWVIYFLQQLIQGRLEKSFQNQLAKLLVGKNEEEQKRIKEKNKWLPARGSHFLLPKRFCYGKARCTDIDFLETLGEFFMAIQEIKKEKFEDEEFIAVKAKIQKTLLSLHHRKPDSGTLATYFADQCAFGMGCPAYAFFMANSQSLVADIGMNDVLDLARAYLLDERRRVELIGASGLDIGKEKIQEVLDLFKADAFVLELNNDDEEIIIEGIADQPNAYALLPITEKEADLIRQIIETMANNNPIVLGFKKSDLEKKGKKINHVHPLRFLGTVFSASDLKSCMKEIRTSYFKWNGFIDGLAVRLEQEYGRNNLLPYVPGFCQAVKANPEQVRGYLQKRDWEGLVKYLIKTD